MDLLTVIPIASGVLIISLLITFEIMYRSGTASGTSRNSGYKYYINSSTVVEIRAMFGRTYRVYMISGNCPISLQQDRMGSYFTVKAPNAQAAEAQIDNIFRCVTP